MKNFNWKALLPHLIALGIFISLSAIYFYPALQGYRLKQGDTQLHKGMSQELRSHREKFDEEALWVGNMFAGMPSYQISAVKYDGNLIAFIHQILIKWIPFPISLLILYMIGFYILLQCLRIKPLLSIIGSIAYAFSSYFIVIIEAGHNSKAFAIAYMPAVLGGIIATLRGRVKIGFLITALFMGLELQANHLQITYYLLFVVIAVGIAELIRAYKNQEINLYFKRIGWLLAAVVLGILPNLGNILTTYEYSKASTRSKTELTIEPDGSSNEAIRSSGLEKDYITQWSYGISESLSLLVPNVKGGASGAILSDEKEIDRIRKESPGFFNFMVSQYQSSGWYLNTYWGDMPFTSGPVYIGILVCLLAYLSLFYIRDKLLYAFLAVGVLTLMLSWGKNFMGLTEFFIDYIPMYNKFRAVTMILVVVELVVPIMAILFLSHLIKEGNKILENKKKFYGAIGSFLGIVLLMYLSPSLFTDFISANESARFNNLIQANPQQSSTINEALMQIESYRMDVFREDVFDRLKFLFFGIALLIAFAHSKIKENILIIGVGLIVGLDLWMVDKRYLNNDKTPGTNSRSDNRYLAYDKPSKVKNPYQASGVDIAIFQNEIKENQDLGPIIQRGIEEAKRENPKISQGALQALQFTELMRNTHYRVLNTTKKLDEDAQTAYFHKTLGGYHGAKMKKYQELVDFELGVEHYQLRQAFQQGGKEMVKQMLPQMNVTNMLNAKYIIGAEQTANGSTYSLVENPYRLGNAWFINTVQITNSADEEITEMANLDPKNKVLVSKSNADGLSANYNPAPSDFIRLDTYLPNKLVYSYSCKQKQFAVFSEIFYDGGWTAKIKDEEIPIRKVNYILRGAELPSGSGSIVFEFKPKMYTIGNGLSWASSIILILLIGGFIYQSTKKEA